MNKFKENVSLSWSKDSIRLINTPSQLAKSTYFYVEEIGHFKTKSQYFTERENLNSFLLVYTVSGAGELTYKNKTYTILPDQLFFIDCMNYQYYKPKSDKPWEFYWVHINGCSTYGYYNLFSKNGTPILTLTSNSKIPNIFKELLNINITKNINTELLSSNLIMNLLTSTLLLTSTNSNNNLFLPDYINSTISYMRKHFTEKITLDELSKINNISKFHLSKEFKKYTGSSPNEYIINLRINYAKELLKYSNLNISEISFKVGIDNVSHFINLFKKRTDITPLAFRSKWSCIKNPL